MKSYYNVIFFLLCKRQQNHIKNSVKKWMWMEAFKIRKRRLKLHRIIIEVVIEVVYNLCTIFHKYYVRNRQKLKSVLTDNLLMWVVNCSIGPKLNFSIWFGKPVIQIISVNWINQFINQLWINVKRSDSKKIIWH